MVALSKAIDKQLLKGLSPLGKLSHDKIDDIISKSRVENLPAGRIIFRQGDDDGHSIYLLSGQIELSTTGKTRKKTIKGKSVDAKFPIADQIPRPATARTKTTSSLLYIDSSLLEILLDENPSGEYEVTEIDVADHATDWMMRFLQSRAFLKLPTKNIQKVLMNMEETLANKGDSIIRQGDEGDYYYIIKHGSCTVSRRPAEKSEQVRLAKMVEGDGFGEEALITNCKRNASVIAQENVTLMRLTKDDFLDLLVTPLIRKVHINSLKSSLYKNSIILDIRTSIQFKQRSLDNAKHIPLSMMRLRIPTLDTSKQHLIYSDNEGDAKAAIFLLSQHGIDSLVILGSLQQTILRSEEITEAKNSVIFHKNSETPVLKIVSSDTHQYKKEQIGQPAESSDEPFIKSESPIPDNLTEKQNNIQNKLNAESDKIRLQAKEQAEQLLAEAKNIHQSAVQDASRLRDKVEKQETLKLRAELAETRNRAESAIKKSEQLAEQIRQQAEQESSKLRNQALLETAKLKEELQQLREHEIQMKKKLEAELLDIRHQATEQARLLAEQVSEDAQIAAQQAADQARTTALREAEKTRAAAEQTAAEAKVIAERLTTKAKAIEMAANQVRHKAEREAESIRQTAWQEANRIKLKAIEESKHIKRTPSVDKKSIISHDNVFNFDDELSPTTKPVLPYADEASVALKMAKEIKIKLAGIEEQRIVNEQRNLQKPVKYTAVVKRLNGKLIIESEEDIFTFKEPKISPTIKSENKAIEPSLSEPTSHEHESDPIKTTNSKSPTTDKWSMSFNSSELPAAAPDNNYITENKDEKNNKSILAIAASIFLIIALSFVAYTTKIQVNFSEVSALVNQDSIEDKIRRVKTQARKNFRDKISSTTRK